MMLGVLLDMQTRVNHTLKTSYSGEKWKYWFQYTAEKIIDEIDSAIQTDVVFLNLFKVLFIWIQVEIKKNFATLNQMLMLPRAKICGMGQSPLTKQQIQKLMISKRNLSIF